MASTITSRGLVTNVDGVHHLVGARCESCHTHAFPVQHACPRCGSVTAEVALPTHGTLWSWTVQRTRPKPPYRGPEEFEPFAVGYVDLGPLRVESRLDGRPVEAWTIGEPVSLVAGDPDQDGNIWTYRFVSEVTS
jgi:uncharacterized OB-fold protein